MQKGFAFTKLADRLASVAELSEGDLELLTKMPSTIGHFGSNDRLLSKWDCPSQCCLLLQGYLCWRDQNERQITSISVPGDVPDLHALFAPKLDAHLTALGPVVVAFVPHSFFHEALSRSPTLRRAFQLLVHSDLACLRNWIVNLGSRDSLTRVAHLFCEISVRLRAVGLAKDDRFPSPFTQSDLASACAISPVHANRVIQDLRRKQLLTWQSRIIAIGDWQGLSRLARFDAGYLALRGPFAPDDHGSKTQFSPVNAPEFPAPC
jgi:CRP-like cAMP-binding protein